MRIRDVVVTAAMAMAVGWVGRSVFSDDAPEAPPAVVDWAKFGQPGEEQARLKPFVGEWNVVGEFNGGGGSIIKSESTSSMSMILGGRFLWQEVHGSVQGEAFEGRSLIGFDNGSKKWFNVWIDSGGTGLLVADGVEDEQGKRWTFTGSFNGPKGPIQSRTVVTITGENESTWVSYMGGSEKPTVSLKATRKR